MPNAHRDGKPVEVPDPIATDSTEIQELSKTTLTIPSGVRAESWAEIDVTVVVEQDAVLEANAPVVGTVDIRAGAHALFRDKVSGTIHVREGGAATLADTAIALGMMKVDGVLTNEGVRGVQVRGRGEVIDLPGSTVRQPDEIWLDGTVVYRG